MYRRIVSGMFLALLIIGLFVPAFSIRPVKASGTLYIRHDGSPTNVTGYYEIDQSRTIGVGDIAPSFTLTDAISGKTVNLANYGGKIILLDFFATWCGPCRTAIDNDLVPLWKDICTNGQNIVFFSIDIWESGATAEDLQDFASDHSITWPILMGTDSSIADDYAVQGVPTVVLIDGATNMEIKNYHLGSPGYETLKAEINVIPEFPLSLVLPLFIIATLLSAVFYKRNRSVRP